jgi:hypothetical protein
MFWQVTSQKIRRLRIFYLSVLYIFISLLWTLIVIGCKSRDLGDDSKMSENNLKKAKLINAGVRCLLTIEQINDSVWVELEFSNTSDFDRKILKDNLIFNGEMTNSSFVVRHNNSEVRYKGIMIKRGIPSEDDYYILRRNKKLKTKVMLNKYYDISKPGNYSIYYRSFNSLPDQTGLFIMSSNKLNFTISR